LDDKYNCYKLIIDNYTFIFTNKIHKKWLTYFYSEWNELTFFTFLHPHTNHKIWSAVWFTHYITTKYTFLSFRWKQTISHLYTDRIVYITVTECCSVIICHLNLWLIDWWCIRIGTLTYLFWLFYKQTANYIFEI